jgi:hypothetical protein
MDWTDIRMNDGTDGWKASFRPGRPLLYVIAEAHASGENPVKGLEYCIRAVKYYEGKEAQHDDGESSSLNLVISLHVLAALHCQLGQYEDAVSVCERSLTIPDMTQGEEHALAIFAGHMQLSDTLNLAGKQGPVLQSYHVGCKSRNQLLENSIFVWQTLATTLQKHTSRFLFLIISLFLLFWFFFFFFFFFFFPFAAVLLHCTSSLANCLETDVEQFWIIIGGTLQAMELVDAKEMCGHALLIHTNHGDSGSLEEARDHKLLVADTAAILEELNKRLPFSSCNGLSTSLTNHQVTSYSCPLE